MKNPEDTLQRKNQNDTSHKGLNETDIIMKTIKMLTEDRRRIYEQSGNFNKEKIKEVANRSHSLEK